MKSPLLNLAILAFALSFAPTSGHAFLGGAAKALGNAGKAGFSGIEAIRRSHSQSALKALPPPPSTPASLAIKAAPTTPASSITHSVSAPTLANIHKAPGVTPAAATHENAALANVHKAPGFTPAAATHVDESKSLATITIRKSLGDEPPVPAVHGAHPPVHAPVGLAATTRPELRATESAVSSTLPKLSSEISGFNPAGVATRSTVGAEGHLAHNPLLAGPSHSSALKRMEEVLTPRELEKAIGPHQVAAAFGPEIKGVKSLAEAEMIPTRLGQHGAANMSSVATTAAAPGLRHVDDLDGITPEQFQTMMNPRLHEGSATLAAMPPMPTQSHVAMADAPRTLGLHQFELPPPSAPLSNSDMRSFIDSTKKETAGLKQQMPKFIK